MTQRAPQAARSTQPSRREGFLIAKRYRIEERLGGGAFGEVFRGRDIHTGNPVAFKMEMTKDNGRSHLHLEYKIYRRFNDCPVTVGTPRSYYCGNVGEYTVMVMELLGPCLEDLFSLCHRKFSVKTVCMIGIQIIERLQYMHGCGYLHRDIKPENFVMGNGDKSHVVYVIDVGLAKMWRDTAGKHISFTEGKSLTGTARYVSINTHNGKQQSRRDDLESVTYLLMYLLRGTLPWQGLKSPKNDVRYERIRDVKIATTPAVLAQGFPSEFATLVAYARSLDFYEEPNYDYCTQLLSDAMGNSGMDYHYQWNLKALPTGRLVPDSEAMFPMDRRYPSRNSTAAAAGGSVMAGSAYLADTVDHTTGATSMAISMGSTSYANFLDDLQDTFGMGDY